MNYNVLTEKWIPIIGRDGSEELVGIMDALMHATEIKSIIDDEPLQKMAILRLLTAFVSDAYGDQIKTRRDRRKLLAQGSFDADTLRSYVEKCTAECGTSFDLFDEARPFIVQAFDKSIDEKPNAKGIGKCNTFPNAKTVESICIPLSSANAPAHYHHKTYGTSGLALTPAEALRNALALNLFAVAMSGGYPSSVNNAPPIYYAPVCDTLFEQLVMCMRGTHERGNANADDHCAWNSPEIVSSAITRPSMTFLDAMTFRPRRIVLILDDDGLIRRCYVSPGIQYKASDSWRDPFVSYIPCKESMIPLRPKINREFWRDIGNITAADASAQGTVLPPAVLVPLVDRELEQVWSVGVVTEQAACRHVMFDPGITIPQRLLRRSDDDEQLSAHELVDQVYDDLALVDSVLGQLRAHNSNPDSTSIPPLEPIPEFASAITETVLFQMHHYIISEYFPAVQNADTNSAGWALILHNGMADTLWDAVCTAFKSVEHNSTGWEQIMAYNAARRNALGRIHLILYPHPNEKEEINEQTSNENQH